MTKTFDKLDQELHSLRTANQFLKNIIELLPGNIFWKDINGKYLGCNNNVARLFNLNSPDEIIGKTNADLFDADLVFITDKIDKEILNLPHQISMEEPGLDKNMQPATYLSKKIPLLDDDGNVMGMLGVSFDITDRKKMEANLSHAKEIAEASSKYKSDFIANLSHDIKTPLTGMIGLAELLSYHLQNHKNLEMAKTIHDAGKQILAFFDHCLEVFKDDVKEQACETFRLDMLLQKIHALYLPTTTIKGLRFYIANDRDIPRYLLGNSHAVYRILSNLVGNAVKFTENGTISLTTKLVHDISKQQIQVAFIVDDTGSGIPEEKQNTIFERFVHLTPSYKGLYEGSGLGLDIVKKNVKLLGGTMFMESKENIGTKFIIHLPFQVPSTVSTSSERKSLNEIDRKNLFYTAKKILDRPLSVLLVEDNMTAQMITASFLSSLNCQITISESAEDAIEKFKKQFFDLIFIDIGLPGIQGDAATKIIRKLEKKSGRHTPVIALTAHRDKEKDKIYQNAGIDEVFNKPLSKAQAEAIIHSHFILI